MAAQCDLIPERTVRVAVRIVDELDISKPLELVHDALLSLSESERCERHTISQVEGGWVL